MNISDLLVPDAVVAALKAQSKKQLLQELAARTHARTGLPERRGKKRNRNTQERE